MINTTLKYVIGGITCAALLTSGLFFAMPEIDTADTKKVEASTTNHERTLYGIPQLDLKHYKLTDDAYFDYILDGELSVGRSNPTELNTWYKRVLKNPTSITKNDKLRTKIEEAIANGNSDALLNVLGDVVAENKAQLAQAKKEEGTINSGEENTTSTTSTDDAVKEATAGLDTLLETEDSSNKEDSEDASNEATTSLSASLVGEGASNLDAAQTTFLNATKSVKNITVSSATAKEDMNEADKESIKKALKENINKENAIYIFSEFTQNYASTMGDVVSDVELGEFAGFKDDNSLFVLSSLYQEAYLSVALTEAYDAKVLSAVKDLATVAETLRKDYNNKLTGKADTLEVTKQLFAEKQAALLEELKGLE